MKFGVETVDKKSFCKSCGKELKIEVPNQIFNFCPFCSAPLNPVAYNFVKEKDKKIKLQSSKEILESFKSQEAAQAVKQYLEKISKE